MILIDKLEESYGKKGHSATFTAFMLIIEFCHPVAQRCKILATIKAQEIENTYHPARYCDARDREAFTNITQGRVFVLKFAIRRLTKHP